MELAAQIAEPPLEIGSVEIQPTRQAEEREVVAMSAERKDRLHFGQKCASIDAPPPQVTTDLKVETVWRT